MTQLDPLDIELMKMAGDGLVKPAPGRRHLSPALCYSARPMTLRKPEIRALYNSLDQNFDGIPPFHLPGGPYIFGNMIKWPGYYAIKAEDAAAQAHESYFQNMFRGKCVLILGVGPGEKEKAVFLKYGPPAMVILNDVSEDHLDEAERAIGGVVGPSNVRRIKADFTKKAFLESPVWAEVAAIGIPIVLQIVGSTLGNFRLPEARKIIVNIGGRCHELVIALDGTRNKKLLEQAYGKDVQRVAAPFYLQGLFEAFRLLKYDIDPSKLHEDFVYKSFYNTKKNCQTIGLVSTRKQTFVLSAFKNGMIAEGVRKEIIEKNQVTFEKDEFIRSIDTHKWPENIQSELLTAAGHRIANIMPFSAALKDSVPELILPFRSQEDNKIIDYKWYHLVR